MNERASTTTRRTARGTDAPPLRVVSSRPVFPVRGATLPLVIERMDSRGTQRRELEGEGPRLDTAELGPQLTPGVARRASTGPETVAFEVAATARRRIVNL